MSSLFSNKDEFECTADVFGDEEVLVSGESQLQSDLFGVPYEEDHLKSIIGSINPTLDPELFAQDFHDEAAESKFITSMGSNSATDPSFFGKTDDLFTNEPHWLEGQVDISGLSSGLSRCADESKG